MANANPVHHEPKPANWYGPETEQPGLKPARLLQPKNPTSKVRKRCSCGVCVYVTDIDPEPVCPGCGAEVTLDERK